MDDAVDLMEFSDADTFGIELPQAVCWERLKYDVIPAVDIPCRVELAGKGIKIPAVRARLKTRHADELGYFFTVQMYLHRMFSLGVFGPQFRVYCQADGSSSTLLHLRADSDRAFESEGITRLLAWGYGVQWRIIRRIGSAESVDETQDALRKVQVYFDDVLAYDLGQLTQEDMNEGFHRRAYAYVAELLRARLAAGVPAA